MTTDDRKRQTAILIWSGLIVATVLLLSRRLSGHIANLQSSGPTLLISSFATLLSGFAWLVFPQPRLGSSVSRATWIAGAVAWVPTWLAGVAVMPNGSALATGWLMTLALLSGTMLVLTSQATGRVWLPMVPKREQPATRGATAREVAPATSAASDPDLAVYSPLIARSDNEQTRQWMTRQSLADGVDQIEGAIRVSFAVGQRTTSVHVPFSPPFAAVPAVDCEVNGDEPARWKVSVVYPYGMRIELKRESVSAATEIELSYAATCDLAESSAA
jgi:hypothetical protein